MKKVIILSMTIGLVSMLIACGGSSKETETPRPQANLVTSSSNTTIATKNDGDTDDLAPVNQANTNNTRLGKPAKSGDADDLRSSSKSANSNRPNSRGDADDRGKKDTDGDDD
ncbi:MAG: hypothetical protein IPL32_07140 [Chloracidobacterium sp.]|nr:hypothetical protein [Chloracidobacterium sp.]